ncbi:hypothetical protein C8R43DRAFT_267978 [Mycena crocata]|nr:hypothetical protein C8R43DRAFT_267978 [Mycena crocata]
MPSKPPPCTTPRALAALSHCTPHGVPSSTLPSNARTLQNASAHPRNLTHKKSPRTRRIDASPSSDTTKRGMTAIQRNCGESTHAADESNPPTHSYSFRTASPRVQDRPESYSRAVLQSGQSATSKFQTHHLPRTRRIDARTVRGLPTTVRSAELEESGRNCGGQ